MRKILVITEGDYWSDFRDDFLGCLADNGWDCEISEKLPRSRLIDLPLLVFGIHRYPEIVYKSFRHAVGVQTEQLTLQQDLLSGRARSNLQRIRTLASHYDLVFEWSAGAFRECLNGANIRFLPYGFRPALPGHEPDPVYDAVFIGKVDDPRGRRRQFLDAVGSSFRLNPAHGGLWGGARGAAIRSAKIVLNIHFDTTLSYESPRFADALSNGRMLLTEPLSDSFPYVAERDYATFEGIEELLCKMRYFLGDPGAREGMVASAAQSGSRFGRDVMLPLAVCEIERAFAAPPMSGWLRSLRMVRSSVDLSARFLMNRGSMLKHRVNATLAVGK